MGVGLFPTEPPQRMRELVQHAERLGYANVWLGDSQNIWRESSVTLGAAAVGTSSVVLGTGVTNTVTRHRSVLASTWATLHELTAGRVALGVGVGDSSMFTMGMRPARLADLERAVTDLRCLFRGEEAREESSDAAYRLAYVGEPLDVPIYVAASGPKILRLAGRIADGVIVLVGTHPRFVDAALQTVAAGAEESGRTLADLHLVLWTPTAIDADATRARDLVRSHVARVAMRPLPAAVDAEQQAAVERIRTAYDYYEHMQTAATHSNLVPDSLVDLFALAGTAEECAATLTRLKGTGIDQVATIPYVAPGENRADTMATFAEVFAAA